MDVNLKAVQDAGAVPYSGAPGPGSLPGASAPETVATAVDAKKKVSDVANDLGQDRQRELSKEELQNVASDLTDVMQSLNTDIQFTIHEKSGRVMVRVVDAKTQEVLKEIPSKKMLDTIAAIRDYVGALMDKKV